MSTTNEWVASVIVILVGTIGWLRSAFLHHSCSRNASYAIKLPALICYVFGSFRKEHIVHFGGAITQIIICVSIPLLILSSLGQISPNQLKIGFGIVLAVVLLLEILYIISNSLDHQ